MNPPKAHQCRAALSGFRGTAPSAGGGVGVQAGADPERRVGRTAP
jgi:hypothetical protein